MKSLQDFIKETYEEQNMLVEDLNSHLLQKAEYVAQREELDFMREQLTENMTAEFDLFIKAEENQAERMN